MYSRYLGTCACMYTIDIYQGEFKYNLYKQAYPHSDSQAVLKALTSNQNYSKLVWEYLINHQELADHNMVKLTQAPGDAGWKERNMLTTLLKMDDKSHFLAPQTACSTPNAMKQALKD